MTTIDPNRRLAAVVQREVASLRQRGALQGATATGQPAQGAVPSAMTGTAHRIRAIDPADPDRRSKAVRIYLESELAREFGRALLNDPGLPQMLDAIEQQMHEEPHVAAAVHALGDLLLAGKVP